MRNLLLLLSVVILCGPFAYAERIHSYAHNERISEYLEQHLQRRLHAREKQLRNNAAATAELSSDLRLWAEQGNTAKLADVVRRVQKARELSVTCESSYIGYLWNHDGEENEVCVSPEVVLAKDHLGNNLLHKAKNLQTITAVGYLVRSFYPTDFSVIQRLQNEKNRAQETPLISHVSRGDLESFFPLYEGSLLSKAIAALAKAGFSNQDLSSQSTVLAYQTEIEKYGTNVVGVNIVQLVRQQPESDAQKKILSFFKLRAPYLFQ